MTTSLSVLAVRVASLEGSLEISLVTSIGRVDPMTAGVKGSAGVPASRTERAWATRMRILRAAYSLFAAHGYPTVTMAAVAAEAGVAVQTLYFTFGTKAALLQHAYDYAVLGDGEVLPPAEQSWYRDMRAAEDLD